MGDSIRIKDLSGFLKSAAEEANVNKKSNFDKKHLTGEEITVFQNLADKLVEAGLVNENYKETLGLTIKQEKTEATPVEKEQPYQRDEKAQKRINQAETDALIKKMDYAISIEKANWNNITTKLEENQVKPDVIANIVSIMSIMSAFKYETVRDVKKNHDEAVKAIKKATQDKNEVKHQLAILEKLELLKIKDLRTQSYNDMLKVAQEKDKESADTKIMTRKDVRKARKEYKKENEISRREARRVSRSIVKNEVKTAAIKAVNEAIYAQANVIDKETGKITEEAPTTAKAVTKEAKKDLQKDGKWTRDTRKELKGGRLKRIYGEESQSRKQAKAQAAENRIEQYRTRSDKEVMEVMGDHLSALVALQDVEIDKKDLVGDPILDEKGNPQKIKLVSYDEKTGTWNLEGLQRELILAAGFDNTFNRDAKIDEQIAEIREALTKASTDGSVTLTKKDIKKLIEVSGLDLEKKNWLGTTLKAAGAFAAGTGTAAAAQRLSTRKIGLPDVTVKSDSNITISGLSGSVENIDLSDNLTTNITTIGNDMVISISSLVKVPGDIIKLAGKVTPAAMLGGVIPAAIVLLDGMEDKGQDAVTQVKFTETNYEKYVEDIKVKNPQYADIITTLAGSFVDEKTGKWDYETYQKFLNAMSGDGNKINHTELQRGLRKLKDYDWKKGVDGAINLLTAVVERETLTKPDFQTIDNYISIKTGGLDWTEIVTKYYPDLVKKYNNKLYEENGAIRALKMAIDPKLVKEKDIPPILNLPKELENTKIKEDAELVRRNVSGAGTTTIKEAGKKDTQQIEIGVTQAGYTFIAYDKENASVKYTGTTEEEALNKLYEANPNKKYDKEKIERNYNTDK